MTLSSQFKLIFKSLGQKLVALSLFFFTAFHWVHAELRPNALFKSGAVLQRDQAIQLWGDSDSGKTVTAAMNGHSSTAMIDSEGKWRLELPAMSAGGPYSLELKTEEDNLTLKNILVGDIWLCSGQSNMGWPMSKSANAEEEIARADNANIRLFKVERNASKTPLETVSGRWLPANRYSVKDFSAVAWYFGAALEAEIEVPIGLILSEVGGTLANNWTSETTLDSHPNIQKYRDRYAQLEADYPAEIAKWEATRKINPQAKKPHDPGRRLPSGYFNGMIAPLQAMALKGVIWYQGETDSWQWPDYDRFFRDLISDWRSGFKAPDLPFLYVMLAGFNGKPGVHENYPHIREVQLKALDIPNTAMALALDVGEANDIHPRNKKTVGERLALAARASVYGEQLCYSGPIMREVDIQGSTAIIHFDHIGDGLVAKDGALRAFQVAGQDAEFKTAKASILGHSVQVESLDGSLIKEVRYAWGGYPDSNLYNSAALPAAPFRTDKINR